MAVVDNFQLVINGVTLEFESFTITRENNSKVVPRMSRNRQPAGIAKGTRHWVGSGDLVMEKGTEAIDLDALEEDGTVFQAQAEYEGGVTYSYNHAEITGLDEASGTGEESKRTVEVTMWDRIKTGG